MPDGSNFAAEIWGRYYRRLGEEFGFKYYANMANMGSVVTPSKFTAVSIFPDYKRRAREWLLVNPARYLKGSVGKIRSLEERKLWNDVESTINTLAKTRPGIKPALYFMALYWRRPTEQGEVPLVKGRIYWFTYFADQLDTLDNAGRARLIQLAAALWGFDNVNDYKIWLKGAYAKAGLSFEENQVLYFSLATVVTANFEKVPGTFKRRIPNTGQWIEPNKEVVEIEGAGYVLNAKYKDINSLINHTDDAFNTRAFLYRLVDENQQAHYWLYIIKNGVLRAQEVTSQMQQAVAAAEGNWTRIDALLAQRWRSQSAKLVEVGMRGDLRVNSSVFHIMVGDDGPVVTLEKMTKDPSGKISPGSYGPLQISKNFEESLTSAEYTPLLSRDPRGAKYQIPPHLKFSAGGEEYTTYFARVNDEEGIIVINTKEPQRGLWFYTSTGRKMVPTDQVRITTVLSVETDAKKIYNRILRDFKPSKVEFYFPYIEGEQVDAAWIQQHFKYSTKRIDEMLIAYVDPFGKPFAVAHTERTAISRGPRISFEPINFPPFYLGAAMQGNKIGGKPFTPQQLRESVFQLTSIGHSIYRAMYGTLNFLNVNDWLSLGMDVLPTEYATGDWNRTRWFAFAPRITGYIKGFSISFAYGGRGMLTTNTVNKFKTIPYVSLSVSTPEISLGKEWSVSFHIGAGAGFGFKIDPNTNQPAARTSPQAGAVVEAGLTFQVGGGKVGRLLKRIGISRLGIGYGAGYWRPAYVNDTRGMGGAFVDAMKTTPKLTYVYIDINGFRINYSPTLGGLIVSNVQLGYLGVRVGVKLMEWGAKAVHWEKGQKAFHWVGERLDGLMGTGAFRVGKERQKEIA